MRGAGARTGTISGGGVATFGDVGEAEDEGEESEGEEGDVSLTRERDSVGHMREGGEGEGEEDPEVVEVQAEVLVSGVDPALDGLCQSDCS